MAEFVEFRAEEWISELEQMERIGLFDSNEIKSIATKRREFEYKLQRRTKHKEDFLKYIQFEIDLYKIVLARRKKNKIYSRKAEIDHKQTGRISNLFKCVIFKFQDDIKLWMSLFKFCKEVKFYSLVSHMLVSLLRIHSDKPDLWAFAARWEFEQCNTIDNARQFLTKGLRHHPSSELLYIELFKLELENKKIKEEEKEKKLKLDKWVPDEVTDNIIEGKLIEVVYQTAIKTIPNVNFKVKLLDIAKDFEDTSKIQNKIFEDMLEQHALEEETWDVMAKREYEGLVCDKNEVTTGDEPMEVDSPKELMNKSNRERIQRSINVYEEAVRKLDTTKMWNFYLDHVIEINKNASLLPVFKFKLLRNAFEGASASNKMEEKYFLHWIKLLQKTNGKRKKLAEVLKKGTEQYPKSLKLWHSRLRFHLSKDQEKIGMEVFKEATKNLPDAVPLWKLMFQYLQLKSSPELESVVQEGLKLKGDVAEALKPLYLEWVVLTKGIEQGRLTFESVEFRHPPCLELYNKMAELECAQTEVSLLRVRRCLDLACLHFGKSNSEVWLKYIKFEMKQGDVTQVSQIYARGLKTLEPNLADEFVSEYNLIKISPDKI